MTASSSRAGASATRVTERVFAFVSRAAASMVSGVVVSGDRAMLIDPGVLPSELDVIERFLAGCSAKATALLLTHHHWDHVLATPRWPEVRRYAHPGLEELVRAQQGDPEYRTMLEAIFRAHGSEVDADYGLLPITDAVDDGATFAVGTLDCAALHLPGHASDAVGLLVVEERVLFSGDMLAPSELPMPDCDPGLYLRSLDRIERLVREREVERVVPGHGHPLESAEQILAQIDRDRRYLQALARTVRETRKAAESFESAWPRFAALDYFGKGSASRDEEHRNNAMVLLATR